MTAVDIAVQWRQDWSLAAVVNHTTGLAISSTSDCGQQQAMNHRVNTCPLIKFE